jgi:hypothetical protein
MELAGWTTATAVVATAMEVPVEVVATAVVAKAEAAEPAKAMPPVVVVETAEAAVICTAPHRS